MKKKISLISYIKLNNDSEKTIAAEIAKYAAQLKNGKEKKKN